MGRGGLWRAWLGSAQEGGEGDRDRALGRRAQEETRAEVEDRIHPAPIHVQNIPPVIPGPARWMAGVRVRTWAGMSYVCHFRAWRVEG